ncbi:M42 family metallopeptidase [Paenibacillus sp. J2TS4]|uniref:M42 family metallopeptidase n=1 Tax=Paenibacillus sp. J2TS4 TaxID=2807194 RepID=UPI001B21DE7D|nr:M42 family metallopeptidase [Paenibacillus sp. J2TS4]GIP32688.1 glutamyl aminopeptidase [Paenibacillus sp. J2TS4]
MIDQINRAYVLNLLQRLLSIPSPSGYCRQAMNLLEQEAGKLGVSFESLPKGGGVLTLPGQSDEPIGLTAHVDTLGAMVRSIKASGRIRLSSIGGFAMNSIEGEYCTVHTREGREYSGTILTTSPSVHVYPDARDLKREEANMEIRLDEKVGSKAETEALGIRPGDYISFDPRTRFLPNGWIKSRHLDDKAGVACLFGLLEWLSVNQKLPPRTVKIILSVYEEVGHGSSYIPEDIREFIAVDMGAIGDDLTCTEQDVSICAKDSTGPYDYDMTTKLIRLAERERLNFAVDLYPFYGSDASAALRGGSNIKAALIGPGVQASHAVERTHEKALWNTIALLAAYIMEQPGS